MRAYIEAARVALKSRLAYRANFAGAMLTYGLFVFVFSRIWATVYADKGDIAGYTRQMCVWYFVVAEVVAFGFGRFFGSLNRDIQGGQVAYLLVRPFDFVGFQCAQSVGPAVVDSAILLVEGVLVGFLAAGAPPAFAALWAQAGSAAGGGPAVFVWFAVRVVPLGAVMLVSILMAGCISFFFHISIAMTSFWFEENAAFFWIFQKLTLIVGTLVPLEFLPEGVQVVARWTPFAAMGYAPGRIVVGAGLREVVGLLGLQVLWLGLSVVVSRLVFVAGRRSLTVNGG